MFPSRNESKNRYNFMYEVIYILFYKKLCQTLSALVLANTFKCLHNDWLEFVAMTFMCYVCFLYIVNSCIRLPIALLTILYVSILGLPSFVPFACILFKKIGFQFEFVYLDWSYLLSIKLQMDFELQPESATLRPRKVLQTNWCHREWVSTVVQNQSQWISS